METYDVVIIGAGPYGLSAAAHLRTVKGLTVRVFGRPMSFWECHMPVGMFLLSRSTASDIADPANRLHLGAFSQRNGITNGHGHLQDPLSVAEFVEYGHWFHRESGVKADARNIVRVDTASNGYELILDDGETLFARRVVMATGVQSFAYRPKTFEGLPSSLVTHTSEHTDYGKFRDKEVLVIGGGRSADEASTLLNKNGANTKVLIRKAAVPSPYPVLRRLRTKFWRRIFYGRGDVGPAGISLVIQRPNVFRRLPRHIQSSWDKRATRPGFSYRFMPGSHNIPVHLGTWIVRAQTEGSHLRVILNDGSERTAEHVVLGTGYRVNVARYGFLAPRILQKLDIVDGYPRLDSGFESSLTGLHFLGAPAAWSFGPLLRFVAGTEFASRALTRRILHKGKF
jgi:cation diffusion facilitator CzcD-associated flavoprotein CzcO